MKTDIFHSILFFQILFFILIQNIQITESALTCYPDYKSKGDNYSSLDDPEDKSEYLYGYEFAHKVGSEYYDHWKGVYWDSENFCYDAYYNETRKEKLSDLSPISIDEYDVVSNINDVTNPNSYILIEHDQSNLLSFHRKMCMTKQHPISEYNHGEYELLIKMNKKKKKNLAKEILLY